MGNYNQKKQEPKYEGYPIYVTSVAGQYIFRFLSKMADQHSKNINWIRNWHPLYEHKFKKIPIAYLKKALGEYLTNDMPHYLPTLPQVAEYIFKRPDFHKHWLTVYDDETYCMHCRTTPDGKEGGMRQIYYYGYIRSLGRVGERQYVSKCDCYLGKRGKAELYTETVSWMRAQHPEAEVTINYFCEERGKQITAKEQSSITWTRRLEAGIFRWGIEEENEDEQGMYPNWQHPMWTSIFGQWMIDTYELEPPAHITEALIMRKDTKKADRFAKRMSLKEQVARDPSFGRVPMSIAQALGMK